MGFSSIAFAGDLGLVCYENGDEGQHFEPIASFHDDKAALSFQTEEGVTYVILVGRAEMFGRQAYEIIKIDGTSKGFSKTYRTTLQYDDVVKISDKIDCRVND